MALEKINLGNTANDGKGDPLRVAFAKINNNFASLDLLGPMEQFNITTQIHLVEHQHLRWMRLLTS